MMESNEILKKILLHMKYDTRKTLSENKDYLLKLESDKKKFINENDDQETIYEKNCLKGNTTLNSVFVPKNSLPSDEHWFGSWSELDGEYFQSSPVENQILFYKKGPSKWSSCFAIRGACNLYKLFLDYPELVEGMEKYTFKNACYQKLPESDGNITFNLRYYYIPELKQSAHANTIKFLDKTYGNLSTSNAPKTKNNNQQTKDINKTPQIDQTPKEKETLKNDPNAYLKYPKDYAASKGMKEWELYKKMFCCPKTGNESIKCNQNIGQAINNGWTKDKPIPKQLSFCDSDDRLEKNPLGNNDNGFGNEIAFDLEL